MKYSLLFAFCLIFFKADHIFAQKTRKNLAAIEIGHITTLNSKVLNEERQIYFSLPDGYDTLASKLPVIYVLDAEYRYGIAQTIQTYFGITTRIPQAILVGIANPSKAARQRDYLPASYNGEAENFSKFLSEELFPFIEGEFKANQDRYIVGHSFGGIFVVYTLLNNPSFFEGYIAIDPSLKLLYSEGDSSLNHDLSDKRLYIASSDVAYGHSETIAVKMHADFAVFKNYLYQSQEQNQLNFKTDHINDDHGNSYIQGFSRGLRYIFNWPFE